MHDELEFFLMINWIL